MANAGDEKTALQHRITISETGQIVARLFSIGLDLDDATVTPTIANEVDGFRMYVRVPFGLSDVVLAPEATLAARDATGEAWKLVTERGRAARKALLQCVREWLEREEART